MGWAVISNKCSYKRLEGERTHRGESDVKMKAETGVMHQPRQGTPKITGSHWKLGDSHGMNSPSEVPEGTNPGLQNAERINLLVVSHPVFGDLLW